MTCAFGFAVRRETFPGSRRASMIVEASRASSECLKELGIVSCLYTDHP